jgi:hypothetical protein
MGETATRWYLTNVDAGYAPPTLRGGWDSLIYAFDTQKKLSTIKIDASIGDQAWRSDLGSTAGLKVCFYRGVTDALPDLAIGAGALLTVCVPVWGTSNDVGRWRLHAYLTVGDSDAVRQVVLDQYVETGSRLWPTSGGCATEAPIALPALSAVAGDRLVVTFGAIRASDTNAWIGLAYGATGPGHAPLDDASQGSPQATAGWIEIAPVAPSNLAPVVDAGVDQTITVAYPVAHLSGSATDDGQPDPPAALTYLWTQQSGPGTATFTDATDPETDVRFDQPGVYVLRLTADDSALTGYGELTITVSAVVVWGVDPDWTDPVKERTQYLTDIIGAYTAMEQRVALRTRPRTHLVYRMMPTDPTTAAAIEALVYGCQSRVLAVPFWPDAQPLTADTPIATSVVSCATAHRKFRPGGLMVVWRDVLTHEAATILSVEADRLTTTAPLNGTWVADGRTYAIPVLTGRWDGDVSLGRLSPALFEADAAFQCDAAPDVAPAAPATIYGYDVFEVEPNTAHDRVTQYRRTVQAIDGQTGEIRAIDRSGVGIGTAQGFLWTLDGRAEIATYRAWLARRLGQQTPFWLPTWQHDLIQAVDVAPGVAALVVANTGYARYQFPHAARRYLCVTMLDGSGTRIYRHVVTATEGEDTETLLLDSALVGGDTSIPVGRCMISFLLLVRLNTDEPELVWASRDVAEAQLECVELPLEVTP